MAGRIPQSFINDLVERVDIVDVIDARVTLKKAGRNYQALCPFHSEKTPSFTVSPDKGFYHCFGCEAHGTAIGFLMEYDGLDYVEAIEALAQMAGLEVPREQGRAKPAPDRGLYELLEAADRFFRLQLRKHPDAARVVEYLKGRGLTGVIARDYGVGYAPAGWDAVKQAFPGREAQLVEVGLLKRGDHGRVYDVFRDRVTFPIRDTRGRVVGFGGRVLGDEQPKYLNSPETPVFHKSQELYGLFEARRAVRRLDRLIVVEGYMDVVALAQHGIVNAVATLGTAAGEAHFQKLYRYVPEVVCCFDGDAAGRQAAWKALGAALPAMKEGRQLKFVFLPDGEDPDSMVRKAGKAHFENLVEQAMPAGEMFFARVSDGLDLASMDARARLCELAVPYIAKIPEGLYRHMMTEKLAQLAQISTRAIEARFGQSSRPARAAAAPVPQTDSAIARRLASWLVQHPDLLAELDAGIRARLLGEGGSLLVDVARYIAEEPDADTATLMARFVGDARYDELQRMANVPLALSGEALAAEFREAVQRHLELHAKAERRALVRDLREDGSAENLARYWAARQGEAEAPRSLPSKTP